MKTPTIVIGGSPEQRLPSLVLEHSILRRSSVPPKVIHTWDKVFPTPLKPENRSRTGFSFVRFAIPHMLGYEGIGAYLECDQLVFRDIAELFAIPFNGAKVLRPENQASVILLDCDSLRWDVDLIVKALDAGQYTYSDLMERLCIIPELFVSKAIPDHWNSLERYEPGKTALLHYTNMAIQPWRCWGHPLANLWLNELKDAIRTGRIPMKVVDHEVAAKHIVPQVRDWVHTNAS